MALLLAQCMMAMAVLSLLACVGKVVVAPFSKGRDSWLVLATPLAGLMAISAVMTGCWSVGLSLDMCLAASAASALPGALLLARQSGAARAALFVGCAAVAAVSICEQSDRREGGAALLLIDGSDSIHYAQTADWLVQHGHETAIESARTVYTMIPAHRLACDTRLGAYLLLAGMSRVLGRPALYAYDVLCAIALAAAWAGAVGVFATNKPQAIVLLIGISLCAWLDLSRSGYLGKLLGYPGALMLVGLVLRAPRGIAALVALTILAAGTALAHSGMAVGAAVAAGACAAPLVRAALPYLLVLAVCAGLILLFPVTPGAPLRESIAFVVRTATDIDHHGFFLTDLKPTMLSTVLALAVGAQVLLGIVALVRRRFAEAGLLLGPLAAVGLALLLGLRWQAYQFIGAVYPCALAGAVGLAATGRGMVVLMLIVLAARAPRALGALKRYAGDTLPGSSRLVSADLEQIAAIVGSDTIELRTRNPLALYAAIADLGGRGIRIQLDAEAFARTLGERGLERPPGTPHLRFALCDGDAPLEAGQVSAHQRGLFALRRL